MKDTRPNRFPVRERPRPAGEPSRTKPIPGQDTRPNRDPRFRKPRSMSKNMSTSATTKMEALRRMKGSK